jgi:uncharacterized protein YfbU (UPF0304 family)
MELTKIERRLLANQYHILSLLDEGNAEHHEHLRDALENGYEAAYHYEVFGSMLDPLPPWGCKLVIDVMSMYSSIQRSFEALDDKTGIEEWRTWFPGFDSDLETTHKGYARYVVEKEHRFTDLKPNSEDFDSHTPAVKRYRRMMPVWKSVENRDELTREEIISILDA